MSQQQVIPEVVIQAIGIGMTSRQRVCNGWSLENKQLNYDHTLEAEAIGYHDKFELAEIARRGCNCIAITASLIMSMPAIQTICQQALFKFINFWKDDVMIFSRDRK